MAKTNAMQLPVKLHRYDEQLRGDNKSDPLLVDLKATLQEPYASQMAAEIERRWNCHAELLAALEIHHNHCIAQQIGYSENGTDAVAYRNSKIAIAKAKGGAA